MMLTRFWYFCAILSIITTSFSTLASDVLDCVIERYSQSNSPFTGLPNPAEQGDHKYKVMNYGERPFLFAISKPDVIAPNVSLPSFLSDYSRNQGYEDNAYHEFKSSNLPLQAKVWLPLGAQPLPLVLLVHGNSAPGFDYLGELLASRGHFVVQVDQTYLNGLWGENGARGWILLEHIKLLKKWNAKQGHAFYNKLDLENIALIGMSRGGEAVALAASFNQWKTLPDSTESTEFGFNIKTIVALAPMDGQYQHADGRNILKNVNYLVLQGGHDADVYQFLGSRQWHRTHFDDDKDFIKQSIYIYRANHINFNQDMSDDYHWGGSNDFYSKLLTPKQQEKLTKVFVSAFLEATLANKKAYRKIFRQPLAGQFGLPEDIYIGRHIGSDFKVIEDFENEAKQESAVKALFGKALTKMPISIDSERLRNGTKTSNNVLKVQLKKQVETRLSIKLSEAELFHQNHEGKPYLSFSLARADSGESEECGSYNLLSDTRVELLDKFGVVLKKSLAASGSVSPLLISDFSELEKDGVRYAPTEPVLQTFTLPIELNKPVSAESELELVLIFEPKQDVSIILDDIGITSAI
ncbi:MULTISPECIES: hypothetical protein [unclassified Pseudoalteromonas]|uniref:hypothetical protein n=1 Tax=unclassified Pseudoalteromonas TaxID=194690 RepID=UPI003014ACF0